MVFSYANSGPSWISAVLVLDQRIIATGYNGTPKNMPNCLDGGCHRCANRDKYPSGTGYDLCICVHAEQNALLVAARFGIAVEGSVLYSTMRPCFGCTKEMLQAEIKAVYFLHDWVHPDANKRAEYERLQARFTDGIKKMDLEDPEASWAVSALCSKGTASIDETGHQPTL